MYLEQLEYFVAIVDLRSMTKAGEMLYVTHQNISRAIKQLEEELAVKLIHRNRNGVFPTEEGEKLYQYCKQIIDIKKKIYELSPRKVEGNSLGEVFQILLAPTFFLPFNSIVNHFIQEHPSFIYFAEYKEPMYVFDKILAKDYSAQLIFALFEKNDYLTLKETLEESFDIYFLKVEPLVLLMNSAMPISKHKSVNIKDLENVPIVSYSESFGRENFFLYCIKKYGFKGRKIRVSGSSQSCETALVNGTEAIVTTEFALLNSTQINKYNDVKIIPLQPKIEVGHGLLVPKNAPELIIKFVDYFVKVYRTV